MFARLYNVKWNRTGRDRPVMSMSAIKTALDTAGAGTSDARTDFRYIKRGSLQLPGVASDQDYRANYLIYSNDDNGQGQGHFFGAWVDSIDWSSAGSFTVTFTDDNFTTFAAGATVEGYVIRETINDWTTAHTPTTTGDFNVCGWKILDTWQMYFDSNTALLFYLLPADSAPNQYAYSKVPSSTFIAIVENSTDLAKIYLMMTSTSFNFSSLVGCYAVPGGIISSAATENKTYKWSTATGGSDTFKTFQNVNSPIRLVNNVTSNSVRLKPANTYLPLVNDHDMQIRVRIGGATHIIRPKDIDDNFDFVVECGFSPTPFLTITPAWNNGYLTPSFGFSAFPQVCVTSEAFVAWVRQSLIPTTIGIIGSAALGDVGGGVGKALNTFLHDQIIGYSSSNYSQGNSDAVSAAGRSFVGIDVMIPRNWSEALLYYAQFGFPTQGRFSFQLTTSSAYKMIQSTDNIISGTMPAAAKDEIDAMLKAGVRCWNTIDIGGYI